MSAFAAALFDLDGVLADTAGAHYQAWKRIADELGIAFTATDNEALKGIDRMGSLDLLLDLGGRRVSDEERIGLAARKNALYLNAVERMGPDDVLPGARELVEAARAAKLRCAVASASRNAPALLRRLGIDGLFDFVADPAAARPKPAPDLFLACASAVGAEPPACIAFEDAPAGVEAIKTAGMFAVGIGDAGVLAAADVVYASPADVDLESLVRG